MISEEEKCRLRQIRAYADEYVNELEESETFGLTDYTLTIIKDAIEDAVRWADSHPKNKIQKEINA